MLPITLFHSLAVLRPFLLKFKPGAIALLLGLTACQRVEPQVIRPTALAQDPNIQVYMNQNPAGQYTEPYRNITRAGDNFEQVVIDAIAQAQSRIDVAVQEFRLPNVAKALRDRAAAGVKVRVILENTYAHPYSSYTSRDVAKLPKREQDRYQEARSLIDQNQDGQLSPSEIGERDALVILDQAKISRINDTADGSRGSGLMHHKFLVIDDRTVIVTSANFTLSDFFGDFRTASSRGNANNLLKINHPELAKRFTEEFNFPRSNGF
jgi:phosphatidylserine/phosphatidylglycerophosphate/cardiolipin synthase-like enzyme